MFTYSAASDDEALLREVVRFYATTLSESPEAQEWLVKHAIGSTEVAERFKLGVSNRTLGLHLPQSDRKAGAEVRTRLQRLGVLRESGHEHLAGSLTVPVLDEQGAVLQVFGRKVGGSFRAGTPLELWLPGPVRGVWNPEALADREVILAGGLLDALTVWSAGLNNVTAALTMDAVPEDVLAAMNARGVGRVLVAYPHDEQGDAAAAKVVEALGGVGITGVRVELADETGLNDLARKCGVAALVHALRAAMSPVVPVSAPPHVTEELAEQVPEPVQEVEHHAAAPQASPATRAPGDSDQDPAHEVIVDIETRRYRVRGLDKNTSFSQLKVNILVTRPGADPAAGFFVDSIDLYLSRQRAAFVRQAAVELGLKEDVVKRDLGRLLLQLEEVQAENMRKALAPRVEPVKLTEAEESAAMELLRDPDLVERIRRDFERCGVVGEGTNALVGYLAALSRKMAEPVAVLIQSTSAAGKSSLLDAILAFVPPEDRLRYSALTGQALYYLGTAGEVRHKVLAIAEEEGAERASYALKLLLTDRELRIASTGKDSTGRLVAEEYRVEGPVALLVTTTTADLDEEFENRCIVLSVDEGREQTRAIHALQRRRDTLEGLVAARERDALLKVHQDAQRLIRPVAVMNPYAPRLRFYDDKPRSRRDHMKYLGLIKAIALLRQHQREVRRVQVGGGEEVEYIDVTPADIAVANRLADEVLGRSLDDLPPHTRRLLGLLHGMVTAACEAEGVDRAGYRFTRKTVRERVGWGDTQLKVHLRRLVELEYLAVQRAAGTGHVYELVYDGRGEDGGRFLAGLIDPEELEQAGSGRPSVGPWSVGGRPEVGAGEG